MSLLLLFQSQLSSKIYQLLICKRLTMTLWGKTKEITRNFSNRRISSNRREARVQSLCMHCDVTSVATCVNNVCAEEAAYLPLRQLKLTGSGCELVSGICPGTVSSKGYHWATGLRGLSSISSQWSLPIPIKLEPIAVQPISSLCPILNIP